jgi:hypothetical protein
MAKANELPPVELLRELFDYDPETGIVTRLKTTGQKAQAGSVVNSRIRGYIRVWINGHHYYLHRICWAIYYNEQLAPDVEIDHINGIRDDNRITQLRKVTSSENMHNRRLQPHNTSGHVGVSWNKRKRRWFSYIEINKKKHCLGYYQNIDDAIAARLKAEQENNILVKVRLPVLADQPPDLLQ